MTLKKQREIALGAVRSQFRLMGINPETRSADEAWNCLDGIFRSDNTLEASCFYANSTDAQNRLFCKDWDAWKKQLNRMRGIRC